MSKLWALVPAAGKGIRFGVGVPKQYVTTVGQMILDHVLDAFLKIGLFEIILVPVASEDWYFKEIKNVKHHKIVSITGGPERSDTVLLGLEWLEMYGASKTDWVFVHDAARPLITQNELHALLDAINITGCPGVILGAPVADCLKRVDCAFSSSQKPDYLVVETVDRVKIWHAVTPQVFRLGDLKDALISAKESGLAVNDESQAMEAINNRPWLIHGLRSNIKLTYPEDLELITAILSSRLESVL